MTTIRSASVKRLDPPASPPASTGQVSRQHRASMRLSRAPAVWLTGIVALSQLVVRALDEPLTRGKSVGAPGRAPATPDLARSIAAGRTARRSQGCRSSGGERCTRASSHPSGPSSVTDTPHTTSPCVVGAVAMSLAAVPCLLHRPDVRLPPLLAPRRRAGGLVPSLSYTGACSRRTPAIRRSSSPCLAVGGPCANLRRRSPGGSRSSRSGLLWPSRGSRGSRCSADLASADASTP